MVFDKMAAISPDFKWVGFQLRSHLKSVPFETQSLFDNSKSRLVKISDPHRIQKVKSSLIGEYSIIQPMI